MPSAPPFLDLSEGQISDLMAQVEKHRDEGEQSRGDFDLRHADRYRRFLADPLLRPPGPWPEAARLFMPITRSVLERLHTEIWQALFGNMLNIQMVPFGDEDVPGTQMASRFLRWSLQTALRVAHPTGFRQISEDWLFDALLDSVGVIKVGAWEPPWKPPSGDARKFLRRLVRLDAVDVGTLYVASDAEGLQYPQCRFVHQEFFLSADHLLRMERQGFDVPSYDSLGDSQQMTERKRVELEREGERVIAFYPDSTPYVEAYERFVVDDEEEDVIVSYFPEAQVAGTSHNTAANHGRFAGARRLIDVFPQDDRPRRPFFPSTVWRQPRQWRGLNVPDRLESMQDLINRLHEQLVNYGDVSMLPYVFVNTFLTGELPDLRTVRPGSTVPIDDLNGVQFAPTRSLNRHFAEQIQLSYASIERDTNVSDYNLGRNQDKPGRTPATTALAVLGEARKSYAQLVSHVAEQASDLLTFAFRLWQEIIPDDTYVQMFDPEPSAEDAKMNLWDRLFAPAPLTETGQAPRPQRVALPISKEQLSGCFDAHIEVNPNEQFDRQVAMSLFQLTSPAIPDYPLGTRLMLKRLWGSFDARGFDEVYPEEIALRQTQLRELATQVQIATFEMQLRQYEQQDAQQQLAQLQQGAQSFHQTGAISPQFAQAVQGMLASGGGQGGRNGAARS